MDSDSPQASGDAGPGQVDKTAESQLDQFTMTMAHDKLLEMRKRLHTTEKLFSQMRDLQEAIKRELAELMGEMGSSSGQGRSSVLEDVGADGAEDDAAQTVPGRATNSATDAPLSGDDPLPTVIPAISYVPWGDMVTSLARLEQCHAIEVATNEPVGLFEPGTPWNRLSGPNSSTHRGGLLPERVQINSPRLQAIVKHNIGDGEVPPHAPTTKPFIILRPFKILLYHETSIKDRLRQFENVLRTTREDTSASGAVPTKDVPLEQDSSLNTPSTTLQSTEFMDSINELRVLVHFIDEVIQPARTMLETTADFVTYSDLWYLFPVGCFIYAQTADSAQKVWRVIQRTGGRRYLKRPDHIPASSFRHQFSPFVVDCYFIDFDGRRYVPVYGRFEIPHFHSSRAVVSLNIYPIRIAYDNGLINRDHLVARGREFVVCTSVIHRYYNGWSHSRTPDGLKPFPEHEEKFDSEIVIDFALTLEHMPDWRPRGQEAVLYEMDHSELGDGTQDIDQDWVYDKRFSEPVLNQLKETSFSSLEPDSPLLDDDFFILLPDRVFGFVLRNRKWASFRLGPSPDGLAPLTYTMPVRDPWSKLYLPNGHKEMIQALVKTHSGGEAESPKLGRSAHGDVIRGKGRGLVMLLHGAPGTGKTLTAECAAASTERPLFSITCGDLSPNVEGLEAELSQFFHLAHSWGCVLLLDEADTFLSTRTVENLTRNRLISVFLRILEYYSGIMFLTTNRIGAIDEAFKSRVHIALYYPPLDWNGTSVIWRHNIARVKDIARDKNLIRGEAVKFVLDENDLLEYAEELYDKQKATDGAAWNGREIRNAFQSAVALAEFKLAPGSSVSVTRDHFENIYKSYKEFGNNIRKLTTLSDTTATSERSVPSDKLLEGKTELGNKGWDPFSNTVYKAGIPANSLGEIEFRTPEMPSMTTQRSATSPSTAPGEAHTGPNAGSSMDFVSTHPGQPQNYMYPTMMGHPAFAQTATSQAAKAHAAPPGHGQPFAPFQGWPYLQGAPFLPAPVVYAPGTYGMPMVHPQHFPVFAAAPVPYQSPVLNPSAAPEASRSPGFGQPAKDPRSEYGSLHNPNLFAGSSAADEPFDWLGQRQQYHRDGIFKSA